MNYRDFLKQITDRLKAANVPEAEPDAWRLFEGITGFDRAAFFMKAEDTPTADMLAKAEEWVAKRLTGCPVQYITGYQSFCGFDFEVSRDTLIPRFDTEILAEEMAAVADGKKVLDMCTGTGCIAISVAKLSNPDIVVGCDISEGAVALARRNAVRNGAEDKTRFFCGDLFAALKGTGYETTKFDIIVSNPPYIRSADIELLSPTVRDFEPRTALDGTEDGLWFYERITKDATYSLTDNGVLSFEIGCDQGADVSKIMSASGFGNIRVIKDYAGLDRIVIGRKEK